MLIAAFVVLAYAAACWFSGAFELPFLCLDLFHVEAWIPLLASAALAALALMLRLRRSGKEDLGRVRSWLRGHRKAVPLLALIVAGHMVLHLPAIVLYQGSNDADSSFYGLEGYHIAEGKGRPMFSYGQHYVGTLIPHMAALLQTAIGKSPIYLRLLNALFYAGFLLVLFALLRRILDEKTALLASALAAAPPFELYKHLRYTEFPEILFWGTLSLLLLSRITESNHERIRIRFWYGAVLGIGFYAHPQALYFAVAGAAALFARDKLFFLRPRNYLVPVGFLVGSAVTWVESFYYDWAMFGRFFAPNTDPATFADRLPSGLVEFALHLPQLLGLRLDKMPHDFLAADIFSPVVTWVVVAAFTCCLALYIARYRRELWAILRLRNAAPGPALLLILFVVVMVVFSVSRQSTPPSPMRYVIPLWVTLPAIVAAAVLYAARRIRVAAVAGAALFFAVFLCSQLLHDADIALRQVWHQDWLEFCRRNGVTRFYGDWLRTYWTAFTSAERVVGRNFNYFEWEPYGPYIELVENAEEPPAYLFYDHDSYLQGQVLRHLHNFGIDYRTSSRLNGNVFYGLSERFTLKQMMGLEFEPYRAAITSARTIAPAGAPDIRLVEFVVRNTGATAWHANARNGFVELVICGAKGDELRRQPLSRDVRPGEEFTWRALLELSEFGGGSLAVTVRINDIILNTAKEAFVFGSTVPVDAESPGKNIPAATLDALRGEYARLNATEVDYLFHFGWGETVHQKGMPVRWSGAEKSIFGFYLNEVAAVNIDLRVYPYDEGRLPSGPGHLTIKCNGRLAAGSLELDEPRRIHLRLGKEMLRKGVNRLEFTYGAVEPIFIDRGADRGYRFRTRAIAVRYLSFN